MLSCSRNWNNFCYKKPASFLFRISFLLITGLIVAPIMSAYAETDRVNTDFSDRISEVNPPSEGGSLNHPGPLTSYFNAGCALYGVDDYLLNDSYFFCINNQGFQFSFFVTGGDYEGLDYNNKEGLLFASAGDDAFPAEFNGDILTIVPIPECDAIALDSLGPVMVGNQAMEEVDGIAFDDQGNLFGWAQEAGLFKVNADAPSLIGEMLWAQPGEVEDIEVIGDCIIGLLNQGQLGQAEDGNLEEDVNAAIDTNGVIKANYIMYCPGQPLQTPCETEVVNALREYQATEIEAIDILPALSLSEETEGTTKVLLGFHTNSGIGTGNGNPPPGNGSYNTLVLGVLDVTNCSLQTQQIYDIPRNIVTTDNLDIEGLAMVCPY